MGSIGRDILEIASLIIGLSLVGLLVTNSQGTATVVGAITNGFGSVLRVATFQGNNGLNSFSSQAMTGFPGV